MAIVGIDDVADSIYARPPLTTYHIPRHEMGALAMQKLHRVIAGEPEIAVKSVVYGELVVRESCGAHKAANLEPLHLL
jgi:LacI family transcriptional regulator